MGQRKGHPLVESTNEVPHTVDLLAEPLTREQSQLLSILLEAYQAKHEPVTWQFLRRKLDLDSTQTEILRSIPIVGRKYGIYGRIYGLIWCDEPFHIRWSLPDTSKIGLTVAGFERTGAHQIVSDFLNLLQLAVKESLAFEADQTEFSQPVLTSNVVSQKLDLNHEPHISASAIYQIADNEPPFWRCGRGTTGEGWQIWIDDSIELYRHVNNIRSYASTIAGELTRQAEINAKLIPYAEAPFANKSGSPTPGTKNPADEASAADGAVTKQADPESKSWADVIVSRWGGLAAIVAAVVGALSDLSKLGWLTFVAAILFAAITVYNWRNKRRVLAASCAALFVVCILLSIRAASKPSTTSFFYGGESMTYPSTLPYATLNAVPLTTDPATGFTYDEIQTQGAGQSYSFAISCTRLGRYNEDEPLEWAHIVGGDEENLWIPVAFLSGLDSGKTYGLLSCSNWRWRMQLGDS
jgi:hypothetical protein